MTGEQRPERQTEKKKGGKGGGSRPRPRTGREEKGPKATATRHTHARVSFGSAVLGERPTGFSVLNAKPELFPTSRSFSVVFTWFVRPRALIKIESNQSIVHSIFRFLPACASPPARFSLINYRVKTGRVAVIRGIAVCPSVPFSSFFFSLPFRLGGGGRARRIPARRGA